MNILWRFGMSTKFEVKSILVYSFSCKRTATSKQRFLRMRTDKCIKANHQSERYCSVRSYKHTQELTALQNILTGAKNI